MSETGLKKTLGPVMLWGLGVGYVISGMYFGWNLGLAEGGTLGLGLATVFISIMYVCFTLSYSELACAMPKAGGAFVYATKALGKNWGFTAGAAQIIEFVFAPPAIAMAIATYVNLFLPDTNTIVLAIAVYLIFTAVNIIGVAFAATLELIITVLAVVELLIFAGVTLPSFEYANLTKDALPHGYAGAFAAVPFAIWFYLAIEGVANVAEETVNPQKNITKGFVAAIVTLVILCALTFTSSVGVGGWKAIVYPNGSTEPSDSPLPLAIQAVTGQGHAMYHLIVSIGLLGLVASFHGIILAAGRAVLEFGRSGFLPKSIGTINPRFKTPAAALVLNFVIGIVAILTGKTGEIITIACFGAVTMYVLSMISLIRLRQVEPEMERPYKVPGYPFTPWVALVIACVALCSLVYFYWTLAAVFAGVVALFYIVGFFFSRQSSSNVH